MLPINLEGIAMHAMRVQKLTSKRRGMPPGPDRDQISREVRKAQKALNSAIWSWRRRNES
jgi:hypothetical protein